MQYRFRVAADRAERERAYRFAHMIYSSSGLCAAKDGMVLTRFDALPTTVTLLAELEDRSVAGTVSAVFDSSLGLPCDEIYRDEVGRLRARGRKLSEVIRLAVSPETDRSKPVLVGLINLIHIYTSFVGQCSDMIIEVHPRHARFYEHWFGFVPLGEVRPCPRVEGALAVLAGLDLAASNKVIEQVGGSAEGLSKAGYTLVGCEPGSLPGGRYGLKAAEDGIEAPQLELSNRNFYAFFRPASEQPRLAACMAALHRGMSAQDAEYFGLDLETNQENKGALHG